MLSLTAMVLNVFPTNEFVDKKTGDVTKAGHKVQMQYSEPVKGKNGSSDGEKIVLKDMNVRLNGAAFTKVIGKMVTVPVGIWVDTETRKPGLYIPDGSLPTVIGGPASSK